jgi:hypothetical protein
MAGGFCAIAFACRSVMDARLLQEPNGYQLLRELEKLKQTDCRSISKLMEWVVTGTPVWRGGGVLALAGLSTA